MTQARDLADRFHQRWLEENPFAATMYGIPGYDDRVPDESEQGAQTWRAEVAQFLREADEIAAGPLTPADAVTLDATRGAAAQELGRGRPGRPRARTAPGPRAAAGVAGRTGVGGAAARGGRGGGEAGPGQVGRRRQ